MPRIDINLESDIQPISDFRSNASSIISQVQSTGRPVILTHHGRGAAVLLDIRRYQALLDEIELLKDVEAGLSDVDSNRTISNADLAKDLRQRYVK